MGNSVVTNERHKNTIKAASSDSQAIPGALNGKSSKMITKFGCHAPSTLYDIEIEAGHLACMLGFD